MMKKNGAQQIVFQVDRTMKSWFAALKSYKLGEDWQAVQVWARLGITMTYDVANERSEYVFAVVLTVEAVNPQGGRRVFTSRDYPEFIVTDPAAVDFFKYFTKQNHE